MSNSNVRNPNVKSATMNDLFYNRLIKEVSESERNDFLMSKFNNSIMDSLNFEQNLYGMTDHSCKDYNGGYWEFVNLNANKGFFIHLSEDKRFSLTNLNYQQEYSVDGRVLGVMMSIMLFSHASFAFSESKPSLAEQYAAYYHFLRDAFYSLVDAMAYGTQDDNGDYIQDETVSEEVKQEIKDMASVVNAYLD